MDVKCSVCFKFSTSLSQRRQQSIIIWGIRALAIARIPSINTPRMKQLGNTPYGYVFTPARRWSRSPVPFSRIPGGFQGWGVGSIGLQFYTVGYWTYSDGNQYIVGYYLTLNFVEHYTVTGALNGIGTWQGKSGGELFNFIVAPTAWGWAQL